jgi:hypothetical protein
MGESGGIGGSSNDPNSSEGSMSVSTDGPPRPEYKLAVEYTDQEKMYFYLSIGTLLSSGGHRPVPVLVCRASMTADRYDPSTGILRDSLGLVQRSTLDLIR